MSTELAELFDTDPLKLTDQNLEAIIARMQQAQAQYELGVKPTPIAPKPKKPAKATLDLKDLGLE